jgi:hypothetical protein
MIKDLGIRCGRESCRSSAVESHSSQNRAWMGHPSFVTGREREVCEKFRLGRTSEGYGLQAVRKCFVMNSALAAEG